MRGIDYTGYKHDRITVLYLTDRHDRDGSRIWHCKCDCGNECDISSKHIKKQKSCGCYGREQSAIRAKELGHKNKKDLVGQRFGRLLVLREAKEKSPKGGLIWECQCDCGQTISVRSEYLLNGTTKSCGCLKAELTHNRTFRDLTNQRFGKLVVLEETSSRNSNGSIMWKCKCDCGTICLVSSSCLVSGTTQSCGCLVSKGEEAIIQYLNNHNIKYQKQKTFNDLKTSKGGYARFDFALLDSKGNISCLIEYQGAQHFIDVGSFGKMQREETDQLKREYCNQKGIKLHIIKYNEDIEERLNSII